MLLLRLLAESGHDVHVVPTASALEFVLEGLYLSRRLNKDGGDAPGSVRYEGPVSG